MELIATTFGGLEPVLEGELASLGVSGIRRDRRAVAFQGDLGLLYQANLRLRTALRVLRPIHRFTARNERQLYAAAASVKWDAFMGVDDTLAIDTAVHSPYFRHSKYAALLVKDAIVDRFRAHTGRRPSVDLTNPVLRLHLHIRHDRCTLSLDSSGESLHRRGYRQERTQAPLSEAVAAAIVLLSGWDGRTPLVDPMCGSGTLAIEAALVALRRAPGLLRHEFALMRWRDFEPALWRKVCDEARALEVSHAPAPIVAADSSPTAQEATLANTQRAGVNEAVTMRFESFERFMPPQTPGVVLMNPPYGRRLHVDNVAEAARGIGRRLREAYQGYHAWIVAPPGEFFKHLGLRATSRHRLDNGGMNVELREFPILPR
jgi:putative N6-adenine-specific DNA methylase